MLGPAVICDDFPGIEFMSLVEAFDALHVDRFIREWSVGEPLN